MFVQTLDQLLKRCKILCHKETTSSSAFSSCPKHLKEWGSSALLNLMSHSKNPSLLPESLTAIWQVFYESWPIYIFFCPNSKSSVTKHCKCSISKQRIKNLLSVKDFNSGGNSEDFEDSNRISANRNPFWCHLSAYKLKSRSLLHKEILLVSCSCILIRKEDSITNSSWPSLIY